jgi:hypothetical protein
MQTLSPVLDRQAWIDQVSAELISASKLMSPTMAAGFAADLWPAWGHLPPVAATQYFLDPAVEYPSTF